MSITNYKIFYIWFRNYVKISQKKSFSDSTFLNFINKWHFIMGNRFFSKRFTNAWFGNQVGFLVNLFNKIFFLIRVLPQIKKFHISGPIDNKIQLFTDESIECLFTLNNNSKDCENLRNVRLVFLFALFKLVTIFLF